MALNEYLNGGVPLSLSYLSTLAYRHMQYPLQFATSRINKVEYRDDEQMLIIHLADVSRSLHMKIPKRNAQVWVWETLGPCHDKGCWYKWAFRFPNILMQRPVIVQHTHSVPGDGMCNIA